MRLRVYLTNCQLDYVQLKTSVLADLATVHRLSSEAPAEGVEGVPRQEGRVLSAGGRRTAHSRCRSRSADVSFQPSRPSVHSAVLPSDLPGAPVKCTRTAEPDGPGLPPELSWAAIRELLQADIIHRMHRLACHGLAGLFEDLHPTIRLDGNVLRVGTQCDQAIEAGGNGLVLMPSAFSRTTVFVATDPIHAPVLVYPARGIPDLPKSWTLKTLAGFQRFLRHRGELLEHLGEHRTIDELATLNAQRPAAIAGALETLVSEGLVERTRCRHSYYRRTGLGGLLGNPWCDGCRTRGARQPCLTRSPR